ncbi:hypothetical protein HDF17_002133 [Granulicella arctica]|uniref:Uncharacterized protein n=1 Tax=Granulicella arctica TaxID=940613 RepID=A0A7Y9TTB3_9BACT|nr:hypothetical protein [Granulicella arctica]
MLQQFAERDRADDHQIDIVFRIILSAHKRTVDESEFNCFSQESEWLRELVEDASGLGKQCI